MQYTCQKAIIRGGYHQQQLTLKYASCYETLLTIFMYALMNYGYMDMHFLMSKFKGVGERRTVAQGPVDCWVR